MTNINTEQVRFPEHRIHSSAGNTKLVTNRISIHRTDYTDLSEKRIHSGTGITRPLTKEYPFGFQKLRPLANRAFIQPHTTFGHEPI